MFVHKHSRNSVVIIFNFFYITFSFIVEFNSFSTFSVEATEFKISFNENESMNRANVLNCVNIVILSLYNVVVVESSKMIKKFIFETCFKFAN